MGHPVIAMPMMLVGVATLLTGFYERNLLIILFALAIWRAFLSANEQATKYRAWKLQWDALAPNGPPSPRRNGGKLLTNAMLCLALLVGFLSWPYYAAHAAGFALGWLCAHPAVLAIPVLVVLGLIVHRLRRARPNAKPAALVRVVAKRTLPVPTLDAAYRALPPYCHALFGRQS
jgi:hypothetical protein